MHELLNGAAGQRVLVPFAEPDEVLATVVASYTFRGRGPDITSLYSEELLRNLVRTTLAVTPGNLHRDQGLEKELPQIAGWPAGLDGESFRGDTFSAHLSLIDTAIENATLITQWMSKANTATMSKRRLLLSRQAK